ncbi:hypothetical protein [Nocardia jejuensis]|nr:hypothetical protein [Nocardia jejuensis]
MSEPANTEPSADKIDATEGAVLRPDRLSPEDVPTEYYRIVDLD